MERLDISRLKKNRSIFLNLGFVLSISLVVWGFNYTTYDYLNDDYQVEDSREDMLEEVKVVRTPPEQKQQLPPPLVETTEVIPEEEVVFTPEPEPVIVDPVIAVEPVVDPDPVSQPIPAPPVVAPVIIEKEKEEIPEEPFLFVEEMPRFPGCEEAVMTTKEKQACAEKMMMEYIYSNVKYPTMAQEGGVEGTVNLRFVVEKDGSISGIKILREPGAGTGREVIRLVKKMPKWIPGKQRGKNVRVQFNLPVKFKLQ